MSKLSSVDRSSTTTTSKSSSVWLTALVSVSVRNAALLSFGMQTLTRGVRG
jgi:hypothetical protein